MALPPLGGAGLPPFPAVPGPNPADIANGVPIAFQSAPLGTTVNFTPGVVEKLPTNGWPYAYLPEQEKNFSVNLNHGYYGFFVQDQWKVTPKLTFNYGLRYDFESGLSDQMDVSHKGFQPRVGLAYSPDRKTVIRAGFGLFNDRYALSTASGHSPKCRSAAESQRGGERRVSTEPVSVHTHTWCADAGADHRQLFQDR